MYRNNFVFGLLRTNRGELFSIFTVAGFSLPWGLRPSMTLIFGFLG
jgi:hypothetical protein